MGILYVVATPIGNLEDITIRAVRTLIKTPLIACEDTRRAGMLFANLEHRFPYLFEKEFQLTVGKRLLSFYNDNEQHRVPEIIHLLQEGHDVALISDAGTPGISDPGFKLIRECLNKEIKVESVPGPSSVTSALVSSGLPTDKFLFIGYPPHKPGNRMKMFENLKESLDVLDTTVIFFEAPHKLLKTLTDLQTVFGDIEIVACKELTKIHEKVKKEKLSWFLEQYKKYPPKGEFVILFHKE